MPWELAALALAVAVPLVVLSLSGWTGSSSNSHHGRGRRRREVYSDDDDALLLNLAEPHTQWFNMGYWENSTRSFPDAAAELCRRVARAARLEPHRRICVRRLDLLPRVRMLML